MPAPLIILTNDDGIDSPYLRVMSECLERRLGAEILVVAPHRQRSASSHAITLHKPLRLRDLGGGFHSLSGSPVDCVYVACLQLAKRRPALVVSGPNDGFNVGNDVFYSGTVGAAIEGGLRGIPSIAVSVDRDSAGVVPAASRLVATLAKNILESGLAEGAVLNVNVPAGAREVAWTRLGKRFYEDDVHERTDPRGGKYIWIGGGIAGIAEEPGTDCFEILHNGLASVTPLGLDPTRRDLVAGKRPQWNLNNFAAEEPSS